MPNPDIFGALTAGGQKNLGRRAMRILFEEMMFDGPDVVETQFVGQLGLLKCFLVDAVFGFGIPRTWELQLEKETQLHVVPPGRYARSVRLVAARASN